MIRKLCLLCFLRKLIILHICLIAFICLPTISQAATYSYDTGIIAYELFEYNNPLSVQITGFNRTNAVTQALAYSLSTYNAGGEKWRINYVVPDDGSTWNVTGVITSYYIRQYDGISAGSYGLLGIGNSTFTATHTTGGTYVGASIGAATTAANTAANNAGAAAANSLNAYNAVSSANGNAITAVRDGSGTVLSEARQAKTNSQNAYNTAQTVNTKVDALTAAVNDINTSITGVNDDNSLIVSAVRDPNGTVLDISKDAYGAVEDANGNTINAVRDTSGTVLEASRSAYNEANTANTKIDNLQTTVNNIQNTLGSDTTSPVVKIRTASGAAATSGNTIRVVVSASDNVSTEFDYSLDGTGYQPLPSDGVILMPVDSPGPNLITVWVKDEAGNIGRESITIRKL
ncbi:MAG: hypothetical protein JL50_21650 [Peptococcaceae bacterium BICA1-7]|nr:MAG: hypothetical protein JL50_21650 [Peptococcaceae bacterium BICA1-7]